MPLSKQVAEVYFNSFFKRYPYSKIEKKQIAAKNWQTKSVPKVIQIVVIP